MIVKSSIKVHLNSPGPEKPQDCIDELRLLCNALIDDEILREQILTAAREQSGLHRNNPGDRMITMWARCLVIKDCIAVSKALTSISPALATSTASSGDLERDAFEEMQMPSDVLCLCLRGLDTLHRLVFVLRAMEGYTYRHISDLLTLNEAQCKAAFSIAASEVRARLAIAKQSRGLTQHTLTRSS